MVLNHDQVAHIAKLSLLAMCARASAASEFDSNPEVHTVAVLVRRSDSVETLPVDLEFVGQSGVVLGGVTL